MRRARVGAAVLRNQGWMSPPGVWDVVRRHGDTCAPVRAARWKLRVPNWVKWGRGREEVEARERQKRCFGVACSAEAAPRGAGGTARPAAAGPAGRARRAPGGGHPAVLSARDRRGARDRVVRSELAEPPGSRTETLMGGPGGRGAEAARTRGAFRFKEPYFWEGTGSCQSAREGAHRLRVMSADQLLDNKEGVSQEKVAAAAATAAPRAPEERGKSAKGGGTAAAAAAKTEELKGL